MSNNTGSPTYASLYGWVTAVRSAAAFAYQAEVPQVVNRIERDVLTQRTREAARYLSALADRLELFDV